MVRGGAGYFAGSVAAAPSAAGSTCFGAGWLYTIAISTMKRAIETPQPTLFAVFDVDTMRCSYTRKVCSCSGGSDVNESMAREYPCAPAGAMPSHRTIRRARALMAR